MSVLLYAADLPTFAPPEPAPVTVELAQGWTLESAFEVEADGAQLSQPGYDDRSWHVVDRMPATVLGVLQADGTYPNLYDGTNLRDVPQDLYLQDWWYRTAFTAPAGHTAYTLEFPGINYRAELWLNGTRIADADQVVGMHTAHELNVTPWINQDGANVLAVKVIPERARQDVDGVELADSWWDWINWRYLGYHGPDSNPGQGTSFVPDRNAGIWKPVLLRASGAVAIGSAMVTSDIEMQNYDSARLTVRAQLSNLTKIPVKGVLRVIISRPGRPTRTVEQPVSLAAGEQRDVAVEPDTHPQLELDHPDLWWPYTMGEPSLYDLKLEFTQSGRVLDASSKRFGIRTVAQHRDDSREFPELGDGGNFYLTVNGRELLVRGAAYTPDLLFQYSPARDAAALRYTRDLGLNMLRMEGKFPDERMIELADELGIPIMYGWMCCNQWERWSQWDAEDRRVATDSLRTQILMLRQHPSAFLWSNGSDGIPPPPVRQAYHRILDELHWPNAVVDTVSSFARNSEGERVWDGIHMAGPYSWRPPTYWFSGRYRAARGANAEQGDNEHIPPFASLRRFIPPDDLWPINETWYLHAGSNAQNSTLTSTRRAVDRRYGPSGSAEEFARKAQLAHYESTRAQFEAYAALDPGDRRMTIYWMLNSHWPSFFGHLFDYYLRPGGAYYGAKAGLRPLSVVFDSYATGDHSKAYVTVVNQTPENRRDLRARVRVYDLSGSVRFDRTTDDIAVAAGAAAPALTLPRVTRDSSVFFIRCELVDSSGAVIANNLYWQSQQRDDLGPPDNDYAFELRQVSWADMTALNYLPRVALDITARQSAHGDAVTIRLHNPTRRVAFFARAELLSERDGDEILPIEYSDNYVTVFPGETVTIDGVVPTPNVEAAWVRVAGYNSAPAVVPIQQVR